MTLFDPDAEGLSGPGSPPTADPPPAADATTAASAPTGRARRRRAPTAAPDGGDEGPIFIPERTVRLRLDVAYDGTGFHGFAAQKGQRTVAGVLAEALATVVRHPVTLTCAGRTDAGVHAEGQVVHADVAEGVDVERLVRSVNAMVGPEVAVRTATVVGDDFDARRRAVARHYRYLVHEAEVADPLLRTLAWTVPGPLDLRAMAAGADALLGEHDFRAFCRRPPDLGPDEPIVRRVLQARWGVVDPDDAVAGWGRLLRFDVVASSFCHQMVRSVVGMLVAVGQRRRTAADVHWALQRGDRSGLPDPAPPGGLCLVRVDY